MSTLVANVSYRHRDGRRKRALNGEVPGIERWQPLSERTRLGVNLRARIHNLSVRIRRKGCVVRKAGCVATLGKGGVGQVEGVSRSSSSRIDRLVGENRKVLRYYVTEDRTEDADIEAASVAATNYRVCIRLVSQSDTRVPGI